MSENPVLTVTRAAIVHDGRVWLMRRSFLARDEHGRWDLCSGQLERGCTAVENMRRELAEETGITGAKLAFLGYSDVFRDPADSPYSHCLVLDFAAWPDDPGAVGIAEPDVFTDGGWFTLVGLPSPPHSQLLAFFHRYAADLGLS